MESFKVEVKEYGKSRPAILSLHLPPSIGRTDLERVRDILALRIEKAHAEANVWPRLFQKRTTALRDEVERRLKKIPRGEFHVVWPTGEKGEETAEQLSKVFGTNRDSIIRDFVVEKIRESIKVGKRKGSKRLKYRFQGNTGDVSKIASRVKESLREDYDYRAIVTKYAKPVKVT